MSWFWRENKRIFFKRATRRLAKASSGYTGHGSRICSSAKKLFIREKKSYLFFAFHFAFLSQFFFPLFIFAHLKYCQKPVYFFTKAVQPACNKTKNISLVPGTNKQRADVLQNMVYFLFWLNAKALHTVQFHKYTKRK